MATNKNQHFVPRCYLRPFTHDADNVCINLYNIDRDLFVEKAPVKNQCSGDYFYGQDPLLEDAIQSAEGMYASVLREVLQEGYRLSAQHADSLKIFWLLQHLRTEAAGRRSAELSNAMLDAAAPHDTSFRLQIKDAVQIAMGVFAQSMLAVADLKGCLVRNRSETPFVTSDNPAVLTNRWHLLNLQRTGRSFGLPSAGNVLLLPLSPTVLFVAYDGDVNSLPHKNGWVDLHAAPDADAFNQHQYINCMANIFLRDPRKLERIRQDYRAAAVCRPTERYRIHYAVFDKTVGEHSRYVVVDRNTADPHDRALIHSEVVHAKPRTWPRQLAWRVGAVLYTNGTGIGYVRRAFIEERGGPVFRKIRAFPR